MNRILAAATAFATSALLAAAPLHAQAPPTLEGQTIRILIPNTAGGINDTEGRLVQAHVGRFLPGNPTVIVQNLPGAAGERMLEFMNQTDPVANPMIAMINSAIIFRARAGDMPATFDPRTVHWIGSIPASIFTFMVATSTGITRPEDLVGRPITAAAIAAGGTTYLYYLLLNRVLNFAIEPVVGYDGIGTMTLALQRGEVQGLITPYSSFAQFLQPLVDAGDARFLAYISLEDHPEFGVPNILDLPLPPEEAQTLRIGVAGTSFGRPFFAPPGSDPAFVAMIRAAFDQMAVDPEFLAAAAALGIDIRYRNSDGLAAAVAELYATPDEVIARVGEVLLAE
ncbi:MAG: hypothetical protein ACWA6X_02490 [Bauldia sp.]|jgi:tripartite-type tricarboxylate transporter receptor subunit TctC